MKLDRFHRYFQIKKYPLDLLVTKHVSFVTIVRTSCGESFKWVVTVYIDSNRITFNCEVVKHVFEFKQNKYRTQTKIQPNTIKVYYEVHIQIIYKLIKEVGDHNHH